MCEDRDETRIATKGVCAGRAAVRLNSFPARTVERALPKPGFSTSEGRVGRSERDATHVFVGEESGAGELQVIQCAHGIEEKGSRPVETLLGMACPLSPVAAASALSTCRSAALCAPPSEEEKSTRYAISEMASPFESILGSGVAMGANDSALVGPGAFMPSDGCTFKPRAHIDAIV
jgi:hypothetical protein